MERSALGSKALEFSDIANQVVEVEEGCYASSFLYSQQVSVSTLKKKIALISITDL